MQQSDVSFTLTLSDGDRLSVLSFTPALGVERVMTMTAIRAIMNELGLSKRIWSRSVIERIFNRLRARCPHSVISWVDVPTGAPFPSSHVFDPPEKDEVVYGTGIVGKP